MPLVDCAWEGCVVGDMYTTHAAGRPCLGRLCSWRHVYYTCRWSAVPGRAVLKPCVRPKRHCEATCGFHCWSGARLLLLLPQWDRLRQKAQNKRDALGKKKKLSVASWVGDAMVCKAWRGFGKHTRGVLGKSRISKRFVLSLFFLAR